MWRTAQKVPFPKKVSSSARKYFNVRFQSNESFQEPKKSGVGKTIAALVGVTAVSSVGIIAYAKYDSDFRKTLEKNVPFSENILNSIPEWNDISSLPEKGKAIIEPITSTIKEKVSKPFSSDESKTSVEEGLIKKKLERDAKKREEALTSKLPPVPPPPPPMSPPPVTQQIESSKPEIKKTSEKSKEISEHEIRKRLTEQETHSLELNDKLERKLNEGISSIEHFLENILAAQHSAVDAIKQHTRKLYLALDSSEQAENEEGAWKEVNTAMTEKILSMDFANNKIAEMKKSINDIKNAIKDGRASKITSENPILISAEEHINKILNQVERAEGEIASAQAESNVASHYKNMIEKGKEQFQKELESIVPNVKVGEKGSKLTEEELNFLIAHAHRRVEQLQKQLAKHQVTEQKRVQEALVQQKEEDEKIAASRLSRELVRQKRDLEIELEKKISEFKNEFEVEMRQQLRRQAAAHSDHLQEVVQVQQKHFDQKLVCALEEKVVEERCRFQKLVGTSFAKLNGMEEQMKAREELDLAAQKAQEMWLACQSLKESIKSGKPELRPLCTAVQAIRTSVDPNNTFVLAILDSIPKEALTRGVYTEEALKQRFVKVDKICRRVALVDDEHRSLYHYLLSYLQSFLIIDNNKIPQNEVLNKMPVDPDKWNTFDILQRVRQSILCEDLQQALRYANQLTGEPKNVANSWIRETLLTLETKQAVNALIAHAAAISVQAYH